MIAVEGLTRDFGPMRAVDNLSFEVQPGQILGFIGPNGAGKSTTLRMITGFLSPTSGKVHIAGHEVTEHPLRCKELTGYLPERVPLYPEMSVRQFLEFCANVRGISGRRMKELVGRAVEDCFLTGVEHQMIGTLSKGYRQRTCFAQAVLHDPPVLVLDEPTDGMDPNQKHEVRKVIRRFGMDKAVIISTHILEEVAELCTHVAVLRRGRLAANEDVAAFLARGPNLAETFRTLTLAEAGVQWS